MTKKQMSTANV